MAKNAADVYLPIIRKIEKGRTLEAKFDIACGPGMLGYFLQEPTIGIDINADMIAEGKKLYPANKLLVGYINQLPLADKTADLALCSLAFQMTSPKKERSEALREMARVLKNRRYAIITLPGEYMSSAQEKRFEEVASEYGLALLEKQKKAGKSRLDVYLFQKAFSPQTDKTYSLQWKGDPGRKPHGS